MLNHRPKQIVLTDRLMRSWIRCSRKAWLDLYGDENKRIWSAHRTLQLDHQERSFKALMPMKPERGIKGCENGALSVIGLRIKGFTSWNQSIQAHPSLLQKIKGKSKWGEFSYRPVIARQGKKITREHRLTLAINGLLLEELQEATVYKGLVISLTKNGLEREEIKLQGKLKGQLLHTLKKLNKDLVSPIPPELISDRRKCSLCSWKSVCNQEASAEGNLSEVSGIGAKRKQMLEELGINNIKELAAINPIFLGDKLTKLGEKNCDIARHIIKQAKVQLNNSKMIISSNPSLPEILSCPGILLYDIESDPDANHDFLHGFLAIGKSHNYNLDMKSSDYMPILNINKDNELSTWSQIKCVLDRHKGWPILHYGETELITIKKIIMRHNLSVDELKEVSDRFIDVHSRLRSKCLLPINSYSLKSVASWTGYKWSNKGADGAMALLWWRHFQGTDSQLIKQKRLNLILKYNKDDCLATWHVAKWLYNID